MTQAILYAGSKAPVSIQITVTSDPLQPDALDMTTVTNAIIHVFKPSGATDWTPTHYARNKNDMLLTYVLNADGGDVSAVGTYRLWPKLTVPGGEVPCAVAVLTVSDPATA